MVQEAIRNSSWEGVYNATAPNPVSNRPRPSVLAGLGASLAGGSSLLCFDLPSARCFGSASGYPLACQASPGCLPGTR